MSIACEAEPLPLDPVSGGLSRELDCASEHTVGPYEDMAFVEEVVELRPSISGSRILNAYGDGITAGGTVVMRRCGPCSEGGVIRFEGMTIVDADELPAGRYVVRFYAPVDQLPATISLATSL